MYVFNGEFVAGDKREQKYRHPELWILYRYTDLREWYMLRVVEPTLASMEEFQERELSRILNSKTNTILCVQDVILTSREKLC